jgi:two-component system cell cycle response regulator
MRGRVLIVAGTVEAARPFESILRHAAFETAIATGPDDALAICRQGACDLVLLDETGPGCEAAALCGRIRQVAPGTMVLVATAADEPVQRLRALDAGADECLSWPASPSTVIMRVHALVEAASLDGEVATSRGLKGLEGPSVDPARIAILDPCEGSRSRLLEILAPLGQVSAFADPASGLVGAVEMRANLALVSLDWPDRPGIEIVRQLRMVASETEPAVLAIADRDDLPAGLCLETGLGDRLLRPIDRSEALLRVRLALRKAGLSAILREGEPIVPVPAPHRLNRIARRRPPPKRYAA